MNVMNKHDYDERTLVVIDGKNFYTTVKNLSFSPDYSKLRELLTSEYYVTRIYYFVTVPETDSEENVPVLRPLIDWLQYNGYTTVTKKAIFITPESNGPRFQRNNMHVELTCTVLSMEKHYDHLILFSGESDYISLVDTLQKMGKRVTVVSTVKTSSAIVSDELRRIADNFIDLSDLASHIGRDENADSYDAPIVDLAANRANRK